jgi:cation diffusion facilitator CzcD-associated flavoprotein CzcO
MRDIQISLHMTERGDKIHIMTNIKCSVAIIGAGLGGLATAIAIAKAGHHVLIVERAPSLAEVPKPLPLIRSR